MPARPKRTETRAELIAMVEKAEELIPMQHETIERLGIKVSVLEGQIAAWREAHKTSVQTKRRSY